MESPKIILKTSSYKYSPDSSFSYTLVTRDGSSDSILLCNPRLEFIRDKKVEVRRAKPGERTSVEKGCIIFWVSCDESSNHSRNIHFSRSPKDEGKFCMGMQGMDHLCDYSIAELLWELDPKPGKQTRLIATIID